MLAAKAKALASPCGSKADLRFCCPHIQILFSHDAARAFLFCA